MAAVGKTSTAIAVGRYFKEKFGHKIVFVNLQNLNSTSDILTNLAISITGDYQVKFEVITPKYDMLLQKLYDNKTILIFDNVEDVLLNTNTSHFFRAFVKKLVIESIQGFNIICTSRQRFDVIGIDLIHFNIKPLNILSSVTILNQQTSKLSGNQAVHIAHHCGGIPLLLELIGSQLETEMIEVTDLISMMRERNIMEISSDLDDVTDESNLFKLIHWLYSKLKPSLQTAFIALSVFDRPFTKHAAAYILKQGQSNSVDTNRNHNISYVIGGLQKLCLLENLSGPNVDNRYAMHDVLHNFVTELAKINSTVQYERSKAEKRKHQYAVKQLEVWEEFISPYKTILDAFKYDPEFSDYEWKIITSRYYRGETNLKPIVETGNDKHLIYAYFILGYIRELLKDVSKSISFYEKGLALSLRVLGPDKITATLLYHLGVAHFIQGKFTPSWDTPRFENHAACDYFHQSFHMHESLDYQNEMNVRTYQAALWSGFCQLSNTLERGSFRRNYMLDQPKTESIPFFKKALKYQNEVAARSDCYMCSVQILYFLAVAYLPPMYKPEDCTICNISKSLEYLDTAFEHLISNRIIPLNGAQMHNVNCVYLKPYREIPFTNSVSFEPLHSCLIAEIIYYRGLALLHERKFNESINMLMDFLELQKTININSPDILFEG